MQRTIDIAPEPIKPYVGMRPLIADQHHRAAHMAFTYLTCCFAKADTPFGRLPRNMVLHNDVTHDYIYEGDFGYLDEPYVTGSRPLLEAYVAQHTTDDMSLTEKVIALNQSTALLSQTYGNVPYFLYGESDEQTILKGGGHCSCQARLLAALCHVIGIEARPVIMWVIPDKENPSINRGGHTCTEVFLDGKWRFFDPSLHWYCQTEDCHIPSLLELRDNFETLIGSMSDEKLKAICPYNKPEANPRDLLAKYRETYLPSFVPLAIGRHSVSHNYNIHWTWVTDEFEAKKKHDYAQLKAKCKELAEQNAITDDVYRLELNEFREQYDFNDQQLDCLGSELI